MTSVINTVNVPVVKHNHVDGTSTEDFVPMEEPLEIFIDDTPYYVAMRLPGEEIPLAIGLCFTEGIINSIDDLSGVKYCSDLSNNKINIYLSEKRKEDPSLKMKQKTSTTYSSCGICGKDMVEDIFNILDTIEKRITVDFSRLSEIQRMMEDKQEVFHATGGTHAAGIFNAEGRLLSFSEDVGRHNALDKALGKLLLTSKTAEAAIVMLSSRLSYEMVQKSARLGVEILCGVSSATSLAIELARRINLTLVGFLRGDRGNIYSCPERISRNKNI